MGDIVERLRDWNEYDEGKLNDAREEAAAEITRLRNNDQVVRASYELEMKILRAENERLCASQNAVYRERNTLVALVASKYPSGIKKTAIEGWDAAWHNCVYIDFPWGQASWHYHDNDADLFMGLPSYNGEWDGHSTEQKYSAIRTALKEASDE